MWVLALAPDVVCGFERKKRGRQVGLDERHGASILQYFHHDSIFCSRFPNIPRIADRDIEALDLYGVLQRDRNAGKWSFEIHLLLCPLLGFGEEYLRHAIRLLLCLDRDFAVCAQDIDGAGDLLVDILDELLNGFAEDGAFL